MRLIAPVVAHTHTRIATGYSSGSALAMPPVSPRRDHTVRAGASGSPRGSASTLALGHTLPETVRCNEGLWTFRLSSSSGEASWVSGGMLEGRPTLTRALKGASAPGLPELAPRAGLTRAPLAASLRSCDTTTRTHIPYATPHTRPPAASTTAGFGAPASRAPVSARRPGPASIAECAPTRPVARSEEVARRAAVKKRAGIFVDETAYRRYAATTPVPSADYDRAAAAWGARRVDGGRFDCALSPQTAVRPTYRSLDAWTARYVTSSTSCWCGCSQAPQTAWAWQQCARRRASALPLSGIRTLGCG